MSRIFTLQPAPIVDGIAPDGSEMTRLPYPFHCDEDGAVDRQDFWRGDPLRVLGFQKRLDVQRVDLHWADFVKGDPQRAVNMYAVTQDYKGGIASQTVAIAQVDVHLRPEVLDASGTHWAGDGTTRGAEEQ